MVKGGGKGIDNVGIFLFSSSLHPSLMAEKVSQTPESTVWRSVWAAGAHTEQEEEVEVEVEEGQQKEREGNLTSMRAANQDFLIQSTS